MEAFNDYTERFLASIEAMGLKDSDVVNALDDLSKGTMSKIRNSRCGVSMNTLQAFCVAYPTINPDYILTGRGDMFKDEESAPKESKAEQTKKEIIKIKLTEMPNVAAQPSRTGMSIVDVSDETFTRLGYKKPKAVKDYKMIALDLAERVTRSASTSEEMIGLVSKSFLDRIGLLEKEKALVEARAAKLEAKLAAMNVDVKKDL